MHLFAQGGFDKAEFRRVVAILHLARYGEGRVDAALFGKQLQRRQTPPAGDDGVLRLIDVFRGSTCGLPGQARRHRQGNGQHGPSERAGR